jgi:hypothetical protein
MINGGSWTSGDYFDGERGHISMRKDGCSWCDLLDLPINAGLRDTLARREYTRPIEDATSPFDAIGIGRAGLSLFGAGIKAASVPIASQIGRSLASKPSAYSVAFETTIAKTSIGTRSAHFAAANKNLEFAIKSDTQFAKMVNGLGIRVPEKLGQSPANWTWHHVPDRPGVLQLVPRDQHNPGSIWQRLLHPDRKGGFNQRGSEY